MHFRVQTDEMNYGLGMVTRAISARPVKPVYDGVLIESNGDGLVLTCTDGEISIKATVSALVEEDGCALLPARLFAEMMRKQPVGEVDIKVDERMRAVIKSRGSNTSMACMAAEDYPDIRDISGEYRAALPCNKFRDAVSRVQFAVSTDESRKILVYDAGIFLTVRFYGFFSRRKLSALSVDVRFPAAGYHAPVGFVSVHGYLHPAAAGGDAGVEVVIV